ncbi:MAG: FAD-dependent oxidoreductase [bacterium]
MDINSLTLLCTTTGTTGNKTGTWRFMHPVFETKLSPCADSCPAGNPIEMLMTLAGENLAEEALRILKTENPLPGVCGRVCPHPCVTACNRRERDSAVAVNIVERLTADAEEKYGLCLPAPAQKSGKMIAVIGSGPAGLSCAYHAALLGHCVAIFEATDKPGGLLRYGIPAYRLPRNVLDRELAFIQELGIELKTGSRITSDDAEKLAADFDAVCVASGAYKSIGLGLSTDIITGVIPVLDFLASVNAGEKISVEKHVVVVGGGNSAMDAARAARRSGARDVTIVYRRARADMPAFHDEIEEAEEEGVKLVFHANPAALIDKNGKLKAVQCIKMEPGEPDSSGRARPVPVPGSEFELKADTILEAIGSAADIPLNINGSLETDTWGKTNNEKIYICGDAGPNTRTVAHAIGSGKRAAISMDCLLRGGDIEAAGKRISIGRKGAVSAALYRNGESAFNPDSVVQAKNINFAYFKKSEASKTVRTDPKKRLRGFDEINIIAGSGASAREATRCFHCGVCNDCGNCLLFCPDMSILEKVSADADAPGFDSDHCKGCGICARECPRGIIAMIEE